MTVGNLLKKLEVGNHASNARYPDGSGGEDQFTLAIIMDGHGNFLHARVKEAIMLNGGLIVRTSGIQATG